MLDQKRFDVLSDWSEEGLETLECCPICGSVRRSILYEGLHDDIFCCAPGVWTLWRCDDCRSAYIDPRPTPETIHLAYTHYHTHAPPVPVEEAEHLQGYVAVRRALANGYRNWRYGTKLHPSHPFGIAAAFAFPHLRRRLDVPYRHLPRPSATGNRRLLDVGFGSGAYLDLAASAGWNVCGCDPDPVAVENARRRGLDVRQGGVEVWADNESFFDVVSLRHVIEHVHDPVWVLRSIFKLLRPGGQFYFDTPNIDALGHQHYGQFWVGLDPPRHLVLLGWRTTKKLLTEIGFRAIQRKNYPVMATFGFASAKLAAGLAPFGPEGTQVDGPSLSLRLRAKLAHDRSEFITLICRKPE